MSNIRSNIDLIESKSRADLEQIKLPYARTDLAPIKSAATLDYHYGHLYKGYVDRFNQGEGDATFNEAGAFLHSIYFSQFQTPGSRQPTGLILSLIERNHKNFQDFKDKFKAEAMKLQGSNWIYLSQSGQIKTIHNHAKRTDIALLVDWWEHAWALDYQSKKEKYLDNIWRIMDWDAINLRLIGTE
jgi:Fe-Mn family superoxide dismutase